jgi:hypothetical protein
MLWQRTATRCLGTTAFLGQRFVGWIREHNEVRPHNSLGVSRPPITNPQPPDTILLTVRLTGKPAILTDAFLRKACFFTDSCFKECDGGLEHAFIVCDK